MVCFPRKIDALLADASFWRNGTASVSIILSPENTFVQRLDVPVDDQYYVDTIPYLLGLVKDKQFNYHYYLLALNRDSMKLYKVDHTTVTPVELPKDAPTDVVTALGDELTGGNLNFSTQGSSNGSKEGVAYHSINTKDKEVEIDWVNYYQAVDTFLKINWIILKNYRFIFMLYQKTKHSLKRLLKILIMIAQFQLLLHLHKQPFKISAALVKK